MVYMYHSFLIHSSADGHLGCFHVFYFLKSVFWSFKNWKGPIYWLFSYTLCFLSLLNRKQTQKYRTDFGTLWEKARVGWFERIALKHVYYQVRNRSPVQVGCMRQVLGPGALGIPRGIGWGGRREGGSRWGTCVNPWLIHVNVWQKPLQCCKVISLQLIKINEKKNTI